MDTTKIIKKIKYGNVELKMKSTTLQTKTVVPSTEEQLVLPDIEYGGLESVTVNGVTSAIDENIIPANIRKGKNILGVEGILEPDRPDQNKTIVPTKQPQAVYADPGYELAEVIVEGVTSSVDENILATNIKKGVSILGVEGNLEPDKPDQSKVVSPSVEEQVVRADTGYELASVTVEGVTSDIDENIQADNIRYGVEILGVVGTMEQKEDLDVELNEQESLLSDLQSQVDNLPEINLNVATATESDVIKGKTFFSGDNVMKTGTFELKLQEKTFTKNGTYNASDDGIDGYSSVVVDIGAKINLPLPSAFGKVTFISYVKITDDKLLVSSGTTGCGLWLYTISTNSMVELYTEGEYWQYFQQVTNTRWLIGSSSRTAGGILIYDSVDNSVIRYSHSYYFDSFQQVTDTKWLIGCGDSSWSGGGILLYDTSTSEIKTVYSSGYDWAIFQQVTNTKWLISSANGSAGVLVYDSSVDTVAKLYSSGKDWNFFQPVTDTKWLISSYREDTGILLYESVTDTLTRIYASSCSWTGFLKTAPTEWLIGNAHFSGDAGVLRYNSETDEIEQLYATGRSWDNFQQVTDTRWLICGGATGVLVYDTTERTLTELAIDSPSLSVYYQISDNKWLITSDSSAGKGVVLYNVESNTVVSLYQTGAWPKIKQVTATKYVMTGSSNKGVLSYDSSTDTITQVYTSSTWSFLQPIGNKCLITSNTAYDNSYGVILYDAETDTASKIFTSGYKFDLLTLNEDGTGCFIESSDKSVVKYVLYYDVDTNILRTSSYYLGEI